jgi:hypothetical protein
VYGVPLAPGIWVEVGLAAALLVADEDIVDEDVADVVAELVASVDLVAWHPAPISANAAIAAENAAVCLGIARIIFLSN